MTAIDTAIILVKLRMKPRGPIKTKHHEITHPKRSVLYFIVRRLQNL
jgi:hypothetical protein